MYVVQTAGRFSGVAIVAPTRAHRVSSEYMLKCRSWSIVDVLCDVDVEVTDTDGSVGK